MTLDEIKETIRIKLPSKLIALIDELGLTVSVHDLAQCDPPRDRSFGAAYIYSTDRVVQPDDEHPWRSTELGLEDGYFIREDWSQQQIFDSIDSVCLSFVRERKYMAIVKETSSWKEFQERVGCIFNNKQAYDALVARRNASAT